MVYVSVRVVFELDVTSSETCCIDKGDAFAVDPHIVFPLVALVAATALREISIANLCKRQKNIYLRNEIVVR